MNLEERWKGIKGKTLEEANELLARQGYYVVEATEQLTYQNVLRVELEEGKITKLIGMGTWTINENKNKKTR